ncbi:MAG: hypothetical protein RL653_567 [Pseudomonadota bacterium]
MAGDSDRVKPGGDAAEANKECDAFEEEVAALKHAYEQYFLGFEKKPPLRQHEELKKRLNHFRARPHRLVAVKFRVGSLQQKFQTYERLWERTLKEIENGTYKRDVLRAQKKAKAAEPRRKAGPDVLQADGDSLEAALAAAAAAVEQRTPPQLPKIPSLAGLPPVGGLPKVPPASGSFPSVPPVGGLPKVPPASGSFPAVAPAGGLPKVPPASGGFPAVPPVGGLPKVPPASGGFPAVTPVGGLPRVPPASGSFAAVPPVGGLPKVPTAPPPRPTAAAAPGGGADLSDARMRAVYDAYVSAKRQGGEDTSRMSFESVAQSLRKQVPEILAKTKAKSVEFKVVVKDGKAQLKAVPKE